MKILYVHGSSKIEGIINALRRLKIEHEVYPVRILDTFTNELEADKLATYSRQNGITHLMSIHLIDTLAAVVQKAGINYIALIWDAPYHKVFTAYGRMDHCWYSVFDRIEAQSFVDAKIPHVLYQPLAVDDD